MRCAVSFVAVTVLSVAVGAIAVYIIVITGKVEDCEAGYYCWVNESGRNLSKCIKPCNNHTECMDGSDEAPIYCRDTSTTYEMLTVLSHCFLLNLVDRYRETKLTRLPENLKERNNHTSAEILQSEGNDTLLAITEGLEFEAEMENIMMKVTDEPEEAYDLEMKPDECEFLKANKTAPPRGVWCHGDKMNVTWNDNIPWDEIDNMTRTISFINVLNTTILMGPEGKIPVEFPLLQRVYLDHNYIENLGRKALCHFTNVCSLTITGNSIRGLSQDAFCKMDELSILKLNLNKLTLEGFHFRDMPRLGIISLDNNEIEEIKENTFSELGNLLMLNLSHNWIKSIHENAFKHNAKLVEIDLTGNRLTTLAPLLFQSQQNLIKLYISKNPKFYLQAALFHPLINLISLNVDSYDVSQMEVSAFRLPEKLDIVFFKRFSYCKFVPKARRCHPSSDGLSTGANLLIGQSRIAAWLVGLFTLLGNMLVLANRWGRRKSHSGRSEITEILNIFVTNLAVADLLMGIYLLILAVKDMEFRGSYHSESMNWATSWCCSFAGVIAMISSEVSLLTLTIMSLERYLTIGGPFSQRQNLNVSLARASMVVIWIFACTLALAPAFQWHTEQTLFYGSTGLCFPIHLDERYPLGWQYTAFVFIGVNTACLALITISYSLLFRSVQDTQRHTPLMKKNIALAMRFFLMVITDVLCWAPIVSLKWAVLKGYILPNEIIGWVVIYILPLNSAVNPVLYTFSTPGVWKAMTLQMNQLLENLELNRLLPSQSDANNAMELQGTSRNWILTRRSRTMSGTHRRNMAEMDTPVNTTGATEDTELTHSTCPTILSADCNNKDNPEK